VYKHILVPTDGSALSLKAARAAAELAARLGAKVSALYVIPPFIPPATSEMWVSVRDLYSPREYDKTMQKEAAAFTAKVERVARAKKVACAHVAVTAADPWKAIIETARTRKCDLIVMSSHGRRGLAGLLLGSETQKVLTHTRIPVLVCR